MTERYVELHARSAFSFLEGASLPEELAAACADRGMPAMALLDRDGVYGAPRFHLAAKKLGVRAHIGAEVTSTGGIRIPLLVRTRTGYRNLCRLITRMKLRAKKGEGEAALEELREFAEGLVCLASWPDRARLEQLVDAFGRESVYVELQRHCDRHQEERNQALIELSRALNLPLLATNGVSHHDSRRRELLDVLTSIRNHVTLETAGKLLAANAERHVKTPAEMARLFADVPEAIANTVKLSARLEFTLEQLGYEFPKYPVPAGETMTSFLRQRTEEGARSRYRPYHERARAQIARELALIEKLDLAGYFLIVWDLIEFCRRQGILVQGRGSAANSAVCYSLGITAVDPVGMDLLFERFLSEERGEWPDIDLDLPSGERRERVIQYVYERYGSRGAAMTANVITYRGRSAAREVGKALGFDEPETACLSALVRVWEYKDPLDTVERQFREAGFDLHHPRIRKFLELFLAAQDLPRHLGQHSGGMVVCQGALDSVVPLEPASMPGRVVVQWDKEDCADMGIIKIDLLGLGMMAVLEESLVLIREHSGDEVDLAHLPPDDPAVYRALQAADTVGMFQVESRAQMACLPRLKPEKFYDIVVQVGIIRPGPIAGKMVPPFLRRRQGRERPECLHPLLEPVLKRTLGVPLFQEQLLKMAMIVAGFTGGEAEELRRAFGFKRSEARMADVEVKLRRGMEARGITGEVQDRIVQSITSFALYGFPESHAASFALIAYSSAYLKCHYLAAFTTALLNNQPMGFYHPSTIIKDAQRHGLKVLPADVARSEWKCAIESVKKSRDTPGGLRENNRLEQRTGVSPGFFHSSLEVRLGLCYVKGLRQTAGEAIVAARPFASIDELARRVPELRKDELTRLAEVGALNTLERAHRRAALWAAERAARPAGPLLEEAPGLDANSPLRPMDPFERLETDYTATGVNLGRHPMAYCRAEMDRRRVTPAARLARLRDGMVVRVAGCVIVRQRPGTANGFLFLSMEDETGIANVIVEPAIYEANRRLFLDHPFLLIEGALQNQDGVTSVRAGRIEPLAVLTAAGVSHDFR